MTYFVGRKELLQWLNALCGTVFTRVEQTCSGAAACQVLDAMHPGKVQMSKVDWAGTHEYEFVHNYKLLQQAFADLQIDKPVPVKKLVKGRYQDNLEFLQWLKALYDGNGPYGPYDAAARRAKGKGGVQYNNKLSAGCVKEEKKVATATPPHRRTSRACSEGDTKEVAYVATLEKKVKELLLKDKVLEAENRELRQSFGQMQSRSELYLKKLEKVENVVHNAEQSKPTSAQTNYLGLSILDVLYASDQDEESEQEEITF